MRSGDFFASDAHRLNVFSSLLILDNRLEELEVFLSEETKVEGLRRVGERGGDLGGFLELVL